MSQKDFVDYKVYLQSLEKTTQQGSCKSLSTVIIISSAILM